MGAEEMMCRFVVELTRNLEESEELLTADHGEGIRIEINHSQCVGSED